MEEYHYYTIPELKTKILDQEILIQFYQNKRIKYQKLLQIGSTDLKKTAVWKFYYNKAVHNISLANKVKTHYQNKIDLIKKLTKHLIN